MFRSFLQAFDAPEHPEHGVHPLRAFFASVGGCIGIGNIVGVCTAVQLGGPGALLWIWITGLFGMLLKYAEVYVGVRFRQENASGGYDGGPMYYLQQAFDSRWILRLVCLFLCIYGVELFMFSVVTENIASNLSVGRIWVAAFLLPCIVLAGLGGVDRVGRICSVTIPIFIVCFSGMCLYVFWHNLAMLPTALLDVARSAFTGHAAVGAFVGSSFMLTASQGVRRACYTGDIGIGYASVLTSETCVADPTRQASLSIFGIFLDTFVICTFTLLLILVTGAWTEDLPATRLVEHVLGQYFPYMHLFMPLLVFMLGYSNMITFFVVGLKCARYLAPQKGTVLFTSYACVTLLASLWMTPIQTQVIMSVIGAGLLLINVAGLYRLRNEVCFKL